MLFAYPPSEPLSLSYVGAMLSHAVVLAIVLALVCGLIRTKDSQTPRRLLLWFVIVAIVVFVTARCVQTAVSSGEIIGHINMIWIVAGAGSLCAAWANEKSGVRRSRVGEWLGVLGGIGLFSLILLPMRSEAGDVAKRAQCRSRLKIIAISIAEWHKARGKLPDTNVATIGDPPLSWRVEMLAYLEGFDLRERYDQKKPWNDPANLKINDRQYMNRYGCASNFQPFEESKPFLSATSLITGPNTAFPGGKGLKLDDIRDGKASTMIAGEATGLQIIWTEPRDVDVSRETLGVNQPGESPDRSPSMLSSYHQASANAAMADGSVRMISDEISPNILKAMTTVDGGESIDDF